MTVHEETIHILHVDDQPDFSELVATFLEREDDRFEIETATSASDGLARLAEATFDCVISDYDMPGQDGIEFLEAVRDDYPELPFTLYTGKGSEEVASEAFSVGATDYLQKESGTDQYTLLANRISTVVENARAQRQRERQLTAIETADEGIAIFDSAGYCRYANERHGDIYGFTPDELHGKHWEGLYPTEEIPYAHNEIMTVLDDEGRWRGQTINIDADGALFKIDQTLSATDDGGFVCTVRTLSDQDELEQRLSRYETAVETLNDPVYVCDEDGRFQYVNDAFTELVGYDRERLVGSHPSVIKRKEAAATAEQKLGQLLSSDGPESVTFEVEIQPREGDSIPCEDHMGVLPYEGPRFNGSVGVLRDISDRKRREQRLERQNRRLDEFVSIVSHDLRNPLNVAEGRLEVAREQHDSEHLDAIDRALSRMDELIEDLLTLAREGDQVREPEPVDLRTLAETCWQNITSASAELVVECDRSLRGDSSRLQQLFENLMSNAVEHGGEDVTITVGELDDGFYIEDDGPGIPEDDREDVFGAGYSTSEDGTGFGLAIVEQVTDAHGWAIRAADGSEGGARFEITGIEFDTV